jgi:hypothetical protein
VLEERATLERGGRGISVVRVIRVIGIVGEKILELVRGYRVYFGLQNL